MMVNTRFVTRLRVPLSLAGRILLVACLLLSAAASAGAATPPSQPPQAPPKAHKGRPRVTWWWRTWGSMRPRPASCSSRETNASG